VEKEKSKLRAEGFISKMGKAIYSLLMKIEGPELEPFLWHSHYLTAHHSQKTLSTLGRKLKGIILDLGAGTGYGARFLDPNNTKYIPTDIRGGRNPGDPLITKMSESIKVYCSCYDLPFLNNRVDGIMIISLLEHLENPYIALNEAYRTLIPGGHIIVAVPFAFPVHGFPMDFHRWTKEGLKLDMMNAGFEIMEAKYHGNIFASLALNINLFIKYSLIKGKSTLIIIILIYLVFPIRIIFQLLINLIAILLNSIDKSDTFPLGVSILGKKRNDDETESKIREGMQKGLTMH
jgi:SAM-dependent methyltransferase